MYRKLAGIVLTAASMNASYLQALGLGEMTMHSALHQPLSAEIRLTNMGDLSPDQIKIRLASNKEFKLAGIDRIQFLTGMTFKVHMDKNGQAFIRVTTVRNVKEPFLDFLIEAKWPTGKIIRSYTALVDLPVFKSDARQVIKQSTQPQAPRASNQPNATNNGNSQSGSFTDTAPETASKPVVPPEPDQHYRVKNNDTLWEIARGMKPGAGFTVQQTMLAIQKLNPKAFPDNNINKMRAGSVLRMPSADDVKTITAARAVTLVAEQNNQWMKSGLDATEDQPVYSKPEAGVEGHLVLSSSGSGDVDGVEDAQTATESTVSASTVNDELASTRLENDELTTKVDALSDQIENLNRLIMLKDAELATLQQQLAEQAGQEAVAPIEAAALEAAIAENDNASGAAAVTDNADAEQPVTATESIIHFLKGIEPVYFGGFALFILAIVIALLLQRREKEEKQALEDAAEFEFGNLEKPFVAPNMAEEIVTNDQPVSVSPEEDIAPKPLSDENDAKDPLPVQVETDDALGEADIYVAYGRYEQAIELLQGAITGSTDNLLLRHKILDIYLESKDREGFRQQFFEARDLGYNTVTHYAKDILSSSDQTDWLSTEESSISGSSESSNSEPSNSVPSKEASLDADVQSLTDLKPNTEQVLDTPIVEHDVLFTDESAQVDDLNQKNVNMTVAEIDLKDLEINPDDSNERGLSIDQAFDSLELDHAELDAFNVVNKNEELAIQDDGVSRDEPLSILDKNEPEWLAASSDSQTSTEEPLHVNLSDFGLLMDTEDDKAQGSKFAEDDEYSEPVLEQAFAEKAINQAIAHVQQDLEADLATSTSDVMLDIEGLTVTEEADSTIDDIAEAGESLDASIEALVKLSEDSLIENAESAFIDEDETDETTLDELQESDLAYITSADEVATKLDLARAYIDMGDLDGARNMLVEVIQEGCEQQKIEATELMDSVQ